MPSLTPNLRNSRFSAAGITATTSAPAQLARAHAAAVLHRAAAGRRSLELGARTLVMGVLNVTPDSFADGGRFIDPARAADAALAMASSRRRIDRRRRRVDAARRRAGGRRRGARARRAGPRAARRPAAGSRSRSTPTRRTWRRPRSTAARPSSTTSAR